MLNDLHLAFAVFFGLLIVGLVGNAVYRYNTNPGTSYLTAFEGSITLFWSWFSKICIAIFGFLAVIASDLGAPEVQKFINAECTPQTVAILGVAAFFIVDIARRRTLTPPPSNG